MAYELPPLTYANNALEPNIDARTMEIHHDKHHATYIKNLNDALKPHAALQGKPVEELLKNLKDLPTAVQMVVRNNGGGHYMSAEGAPEAASASVGAHLPNSVPTVAASTTASKRK